MLRLAANEGDSTKKNSSGKTDHHDCAAGIALTAEFVLDGVSELTRSIFVYLDKQLNLSEDVRPALIGAILEDFADWFADNYEHAIELLHKIADSPDILKIFELMVRMSSLNCLRASAAFRITSLCSSGPFCGYD